MTLVGQWINEFGSIMTISAADNGIFTGSYSSHTGATGSYTVVGVYDTQPESFSQALAFSISWRDNSAPPDPSFHWVSAFSGQLQTVNNQPTITSTYLLQQNTQNSDNWESTIVATARFTPYTPSQSVVDDELHASLNTAPCIQFELARGELSDNGATPWYTEMPIGEPAQTLKLMVDTGTTHTWVTSSLCNTAACDLHLKYNPQNSTSYYLVQADCPDIDFGPWGSMKVELGNDSLALTQVGAILAERLNFYLATDYQGSQFAELACDGGLAIPSILPTDVDSGELLPQLKSSGQIDYAIASFYMDANSGRGQCLLGAVDSTKFSGPLNVVTTQRFEPFPFLWVIKLNAISLASTPILSSINFALDTGSSRFKGDAGYIARLIAAVTLNGQLPQTQPSQNPDFSQYPILYLNINGTVYPLRPDQYFLPRDSATLELAFKPMTGLEGLLLVGSTFLETVYTVFYYQTGVTGVQAIGLGKLSSTN